MSDTLICPTCQKDISAAYSFCPHCRSQVKCRNSECQQPLIADVDMCVYCGTAIQSNILQPSRNKFKLVRKPGKYGVAEEIEADFTNHAATELAAVIGGTIVGRPQQQPPFQVRPNHVQPTVSLSAPTETHAEQEPAVEESTQEAPPPTPVNTNPQGASRFFRCDGDHLLAETKDYKGKNWSQQQSRFILLYASAYECLFDKSVPDKEHFKAAAEREKVLDKNNFARYLTGELKQFFLETSTGPALNGDGKKEVEHIIAEMDNPQTAAGDAYWERSPANATEKYRLPKEDKLLFQQWAKEDVGLGGLNILDIETGRDYALLAYWLLITHLKKRDKFRWNEALEYLKTKYQTISVTPSAFSKAVASANNGELFRKNGDAYFLSNEAIALVEKWIDGTAKPGSDDKKKD